MMNATLKGKPDAGNLHVVRANGCAKPRRGSLLCNAKISVFGLSLVLTGWAFAAVPQALTVTPGTYAPCGVDVRNFTLTARVKSDAGAEARLSFHTDPSLKGYQILFRNGPIDGTRKTGSLSHVRNLYRSMAADGAWYDFALSVRGKNIEVRVDGVTVVNYTEPEKPYRTAANAAQLLSHGDFAFIGVKGGVAFRDIRLVPLAEDARNPADTLPPVDEQTDRAIRKQQVDFPVIDFHVHLKGGLTKEEAIAKSFNYGINYGIVPNVGEGGVGRMLRSDAEAEEYLREVAPLPFLCGVQGEGRKWPYEFSKAQLLKFDYMFTDSMTVVDGGVPLRIYRPAEFRLNGRSCDEWMDYLVDQIVKILTNEPVDYYANATFLPPPMDRDYERYWTDARINRVLDVLSEYGIALEISARYRIPSAKIIRMAKARGIKFTFGTNNEKKEFGRLEYALDMVDACGLAPEDVWFPSMSVRKNRTFRPYNDFATPAEPHLSVFAKFIRMTAKERGLSLSEAADLLYGLGIRGYGAGCRERADARREERRLRRRERDRERCDEIVVDKTHFTNDPASVCAWRDAMADLIEESLEP